jgi:hypothetical protein
MIVNFLGHITKKNEAVLVRDDLVAMLLIRLSVAAASAAAGTATAAGASAGTGGLAAFLIPVKLPHHQHHQGAHH